MKNCNLLTFFFAALFFHAAVHAQTNIPAGQARIGYTNIDIVLSRLPESKVMQSQLEVTKAQLEKAISETVKEFQEKLAAYQKNAAQITDVIRADKEKELESLQARVQESRTNAEQSLQSKQQQLIEPVFKKINAAIQAVGQENGFVYIFNMDAGQGTTPFILFAASEENNVTNLILKKLGVDPDKTEAAAASKK
ncbi:OmpH family outer membrane protein [Dyadobacter flavalbus]|uniref:OmpH family outer membrane protein n=1 Tax=Dyadobacter flavalbus TaxID=2579942 RepID=A0A5M8QYA3_9BACT|nr:OmpH family outer membrane protein [Dyadobacter flavalbus]KAA6438972.1 OmpH family outer membrane protein [Dyadobacter flavalbus]